MASPNPTTSHSKVEFQLPDREIEKLDEIAYEQSDPETRVTRSDVLREAVRDLVGKYESEDGEVSPETKGKLNPEEGEAE